MAEAIHVRPMLFEDIDQVLHIEEQSFTSPWSRLSFELELTENQAARYIVLEREGHILAYAGLWLVVGEGHITNLAVHPGL